MRQLMADRRIDGVEALAVRSGLGRTTVSQALNGHKLPSERTVRVLARTLRAPAPPLLDLRRRAARPGAPAGPVEVPPEHREFESRYVAYVAERHRRLDIIGLDLRRPERSKWPLDTAYLSLELAGTGHREHPGGWHGATGRHDGTGRLDVPAIRVQRAEQALAGSRRVLVRGGAGSGKTTLLQWLAVTTAEDRLPAELAPLAGSVPFLLPLRTLVRHRELPRPDQFLGVLGSPLAAAQPPGWADTVMARGRAMVLLDGIDEVAEAARAGTKRWLTDLLAAYPRAFYATTTRPTAVDEGWLAGEDFRELTVRPMSSRDVGVFVTRWHDAARADATRADAAPEEVTALTTLEEQLKDAVRAQPDLAQLATTPLLCALVCALNRDRHGHLPGDRMSLYAAALSMLMVRRDEERDILGPEGIRLTEAQSTALLQRLAHWMLRNAYIEVDREDAEQVVADALPAMPQVAAQGTAPQILRHLLARTGLLRRPTEDTVDFVHRTFQDYLGAKAAVEARDFGLLDRQSTDSTWEDVLRMAVGHARAEERARIIRKLVTRGDRTAKHRTRLHLLAAACLMYATELDPAVREAVAERVEVLLPPRSDRQVEELVACGRFVLDLLPGPEGMSDPEQAFVARTVLRVGGDAAVPLLKRFRESRGTKLWEVLTNGDVVRGVDAEEYSREILAHCKAPVGLMVSTLEQMRAAPAVETLNHLYVSGDYTSAQLAEIPGLSGRREIFLLGNGLIEDLEFLGECRALSSFGFFECPSLRDLSGIRSVRLERLRIGLRHDLPLDFLGGLHGLREFEAVADEPGWSVRDLPIPASVTSVGVSGLIGLEGIERLADLSHVQVSNRLGRADWAELRKLPKLASLRFPVASEPMAELPTVERLTIENPSLAGFARVRAAFPNVQYLHLPYCTHLDAEHLEGFSGLTIAVPETAELLNADRLPPDVVIERS
ncbi:NACHT domain-containing protein [Kitasatospora phosalacinea]|nr:NACHT domain-containing protein [Kitasatospora phosalacinea]